MFWAIKRVMLDGWPVDKAMGELPDLSKNVSAPLKAFTLDYLEAAREVRRDARTGDMDAEAFRREGHRLVDWIAAYFEHPERYPVLSRVKPGDIRAALPDARARSRARRSTRSSRTSSA